MNKAENIQLKGKLHKEYILDEALKIWEKEFHWENVELNYCIKLALERHRESLIKFEKEKKPPIIPKTKYKLCTKCGRELSQGDVFHYTNICLFCWRSDFTKRLNN